MTTSTQDGDGTPTQSTLTVEEPLSHEGGDDGILNEEESSRNDEEQKTTEDVPMTATLSDDNADMDETPPCHQTQGSQEGEEEDSEEEEVATVIMDEDDVINEYQLKVVFPQPSHTTTVCQFREFATALFEIDETATIKAQDLNLQ